MYIQKYDEYVRNFDKKDIDVKSHIYIIEVPIWNVNI